MRFYFYKSPIFIEQGNTKTIITKHNEKVHVLRPPNKGTYKDC